MSAEPRMEDLLASIRKAIDEDVAAPSTSSQASGTLYKGAMRELHVRVGDEATSAAAEIEHLRNRISQSRMTDLTRESRSRPAAPPPLRGSLAEEVETRRMSAPRLPDVEPSYRRLEDWRSERPAAEPVHPYPPPGWDEPPSYRAAGSEPRHRGGAVLSAEAEASAGASFQRLADSILSRAVGDRSIEDMTRDLLRGMLKQWLDDNLPSLVERLVREEIERVARRGR